MDVWRHGTYIDLWSFVHFLSGVLLCVLFSWVGFSFVTATLLAIVLLLTWELYEWVLKILEPASNVTVDVLVGFLGFIVAAYWHYFLGNAFDPVLLGILASTTIALSLWGFSDFFFNGYR